VRVVNEYGPPEAVVGCAIFEAKAGELATGPTPIGWPMRNVRLYVLNRELEPVPLGEQPCHRQPRRQVQQQRLAQWRAALPARKSKAVADQRRRIGDHRQPVPEDEPLRRQRGKKGRGTAKARSRAPAIRRTVEAASVG
jgi:non-ribosomal peptide synthetase component F